MKPMKLNLAKVGVSFCLMSFAACGGSDTASSTDGGLASADGGNRGGNGIDGMAQTPVDAASTLDESSAPGAQSMPDASSAPDAASTPDGATADSGSPQDGGRAGSTLPVGLGAAGNFVILAKSGISTVPTSAVTGNLGISPAAATLITGFSLTADATNVFSTSPQVTGKVYASDYSQPTPSNLTTAIADMQHAFTDAAGRAPDVTELGAGNIGGKTLAPGVYKWGTGLLIPTSITLTGNATDVWIFQIAQDLTMSSATRISLSGGAVPKNVFWQVAGGVDLGTTAHFEGILLSQTLIALRTGASIRGRLLAQAAVTIDASAVVQPAP